MIDGPFKNEKPPIDYEAEKVKFQALIENLKEFGFYPVYSPDRAEASLKQAEEFKSGISFSFVPSEEEVKSYNEGIEPSIELVCYMEKNHTRYINGMKLVDGKISKPEGWWAKVDWTNKEELKKYMEVIK